MIVQNRTNRGRCVVALFTVRGPTLNTVLEHRTLGGKPVNPLPGWVTIVVVLGLLGLLGYNIVVVGPEGYPTSVILGGLLGGYAGIQELLKRRGGGD